jgi:hypothetical protein
VDDHEGTDDCHCREDEASKPAAAAHVEIIALISHVVPLRLALQEICLLNAAATVNAV